jgi:hypothetical protein
MEGEGRSTPRLIADAFGLYRRYPLLFLALAAVVIVPYRLLVLALTGSDLATTSGSNFAVEFPLSIVDWVVIGPLVSALHVHAVSDVREDEGPRFVPVARRGLAALPVVSAATIMSGLGIVGGALLFIVPGIVFFIRWMVVAQAAAIEREGWNAALRRSWTLTEGNSIHVVVFVICTGLLVLAPNYLLRLAFHGEPTTAGSFLAGTALDVVLVSFTALATALLYYDLRARREALAAQGLADDREAPQPREAPYSRGAPHPMAAPLTEHGIDPRAYPDEERPKGWYVDPDRPKRMLYWGGNDSGGWHGETRTPRKLRARWEDQGG